METFSMNVIAQTLSAHSEMIAPGVMGINFMKPEKPINTMSEVYKLVQEEEQNKVKSPTPGAGTTSPFFKPSKIPPSVPPKPTPAVNTNVPFTPKTPKTPPPSEGPALGQCSDCGRTVTGHCVNLNDRILHEECFKCSTCGSCLKNVGFHCINNKLYCDMHAKLAARVIASNAPGSAPAFTPAAPAATPKPVQTPVAPPKPVQAPAAPSMPTQAPKPLTPQPTVVPHLPSSIPHSVPTPFGQSLGNLPHSPSSSGGLAFRSISPQPFKRISGDFHKVTAPTSPTPGSSPAPPPQYTSGPLPFEMKPYMPPDQARSPLFGGSSEMSHTEISHTTQISEVTQKTTQITQQVSQSTQSQYSVDYKQVIGGQQKTKFVWPPPKPQFEVEGGISAPSSTAQNYSPLVTQSTPTASTQLPKSESLPTFRSVQPPQQQYQQEKPSEPEAVKAPTPPSMFTTPAAPPAEPPKQEAAPAPEPAKEGPAPPPAPAPSGPQAQSFAPVLPPIVDLKPTPTPAQPGVPTGAGSKPAPKKGRGQLMKEQAPGRIPICADCGDPIRGPFIVALNRTWCPDHFHCNNLHCKTPLIDIGFVEEQGQLYCENCYEAFLAPICNKCNVRIKGDCLNALDKQWHPECFICAYCKKPFGNNSFYLEDGLPYCEKDWNELFTTKCVACGFPIEAGDRWVEALNNNYHSQCFKCSTCGKNLEGQSFYAKGGKPFCKQHAR